MPPPWRVPCLPCLALCPSPSVHFGGSRAEDRRLSYRGVWQCSPRPPVSRGERDDSNDGWEHGGRPRLTRGLYGWALRSRIIKGAQRALPCLALSCAPAPPPPRTDWQGASSPSGRVFPNGDPIFSTPSPTRPQGTHTETKDKSVRKKRPAGRGWWYRALARLFDDLPEREEPGSGPRPALAVAARFSAILPHARPAADAGAKHYPRMWRREGRQRERRRENTLVSGLAPTHGSSAALHGRYICMRCRCPQIHQTQYTPPPVGRAVGGGHVLPVAPKTHACLPACFPVHLSSKRTWTRAGSRPAAMSPRVPQSSPQTPRRPKYADEQKAQSVQPWPHHIHDTVEYFVHSGTLSIPRPWICPPWPSPSPSPSG